MSKLYLSLFLNGFFSLVLLSQGNPSGAYDTCVTVFSLLGEHIPSSVKPEEAISMLAETLTMYKEVYDEEGWINKRLEDEKIRTIAKIYNTFVTICFLCKQKHIVMFHMCRAVQLSLQNGACQHTPLALIRFAGCCAQKEGNSESIW